MTLQAEEGSPEHAVPLVRPLIESDIPAVARLYAQLGYPAGTEDFAQRFRRLGEKHGHAILVAELHAEGVVGVVHVREDESMHLGSVAEVVALVVDADKRGHGVGRVLMAHAEAWAAGQGFKEVFLLSNVNREKAHEFYRGLSYTSEKSVRLFVKSLAGR